MRQGVKPLGDPAEHVKHEPRALSTSSAPGPHASQETRSWLCKQPAKVQGTCASRNDTKEQDPGTCRGKCATEWLSWWSWALEKGGAGTAHPTPLCSKAGLHWGAESLIPSWGRAIRDRSWRLREYIEEEEKQWDAWKCVRWDPEYSCHLL